MDKEEFLRVIDFFTPGEPENEIPDVSMIYDWKGEVLYEAE